MEEGRRRNKKREMRNKRETQRIKGRRIEGSRERKKGRENERKNR